MADPFVTVLGLFGRAVGVFCRRNFGPEQNGVAFAVDTGVFECVKDRADGIGFDRELEEFGLITLCVRCEYVISERSWRTVSTSPRREVGMVT